MADEQETINLLVAQLIDEAGRRVAPSVGRVTTARGTVLPDSSTAVAPGGPVLSYDPATGRRFFTLGISQLGGHDLLK